MKIKTYFIFFRSILIIISVVFFSCNNTNEDYSIENRTWDVCVKTDFANPDNECDYLITYVFNKDGTFYEFAKSLPDSIQKIQSSRKSFWKLDDNTLTVNVKFGNGERVIQHKIKWIDKSTFYTTEKNSMDIKIETWYKARD